MSSLKIITTDTEHQAALDRVESLLSRASLNEKERDELGVLALLVESYENKHHPIGPPTPVEAIKFRMDQQGLTPRDLIPYLGSKGRVSEVLSGKRPLSLSMIRALHTHLGIPAEVLLRPNEKLPDEPVGINWSRYPIKEMVSRGWFPGVTWARGVAAQAEDYVRQLAALAGGGKFCAPEAACFRTGHRRNAKADPYALHAWIMHVKSLAMLESQQKKAKKYDPSTLTDDFLKEIVRLSVLKNGPRVATDMLAENGIAFVYARHLPKTYLDGAAMLLEDKIPVVGITLRFDRIDHFWFCLLHELAHLKLHLGKNNYSIVLDDFEISANDIEQEADDLAMETMIPSALWDKHPARTGEVKAVRALAKELRIHPAIVAGRARREANNYRMLSQLVGTGQVRRVFDEGGYQNP